MPTLLVVDDDSSVRYSLKRLFSRIDMDVQTARSAEEGLAILREHRPDVMIMDIRMPGMDGIDALSEVKKIDPKVPVIIATAYTKTDTAIEAVKRGAYDYVLKPFDIEQLQELVRKAVDAGRLMRDYVGLQGEVSDSAETLVGSSAAMQEVYKLIGQVAPTDITVLIQGESGTGKELVARAIYNHSNRSEKLFLPVNCAAIPDELLESELFGHERGAFTNAFSRKIGKFEQCDGGTIFLDEIGDMSPRIQAKLLRVIQDGEIQRLGSSERIKVDVRIITATNRDLKQLISEGQFRRDLYYRLNVVTLTVPPLRERKEDIPDLARYFLRRSVRATGKSIAGITERAMDKLIAHNWPGNVRELENCIKRAVVTCRETVIDAEDISMEPAVAVKPIESEEISTLLDEVFRRATESDEKIDVLGWLEKEMIIRALRKTEGNQSQAARELGMNRNTLRSKMKAYDISISYVPSTGDTT